MAIVSRLAAVLAVALVAGCAATAQPDGTRRPTDSPTRTHTSSTRPVASARWSAGSASTWSTVLVVAVEGLDDTGRAAVDQGGADEAPTVADLLDMAATARRRGADVVVVETTRDGRPTRITIDGETEAYDDEACYVISDVTNTR